MINLRQYHSSLIVINLQNTPRDDDITPKSSLDRC